MKRGMSLTEILIAMGLMTLGLLGVLSIFPVGSYYMAQADVADNGSAIGQAVMNDLVARGMLDPNTWTSTNLATGIDASQSYAAQVESQRANLASTNANTVRAANSLLGSVIVIDPLGVATHLSLPHFDDTLMPPDPALTDKRWLCNFPGRASYVALGNSPLWQPWKGTAYLGPMRRVTFPVMLNNVAAAESLTRADDDLAFEVVSDLPAMTHARNGERQSTGQYTWFVTVVPTMPEARNEIASGAYAYDVSVVVCSRRDFAMTRGSASNRNWSPSESLAGAAIKSTGPGGGELLISEPLGTPALDDLKAGRYIALCGPHPNSTALRPHFFFAWYQVQAVDEEIAAADKLTGTPQRYVTLRGPEWPWHPGNALANDLCVCIVPSAVAVHSKTLRLATNR